MRPITLMPGLVALSMVASGCKPPPPPVAKAPPPPPQPVVMEQVKAEKGVGIKGRSLDGESGIIVTPVKALFGAKEEIAFIQFLSQYRIYNALNDDIPKDFDDLTAKVIDPYMIKLPLLPEGHKYIWNAETQELMVERPAKVVSQPAQP
ncbi:MAG: hypothetical protein WEH44_04935 [Pirellulaceae bacterium]